MESKLPPKQPSTLPSISEIYLDENMTVLKKDSLFQVLMNEPPKKDWCKVHPYIKAQDSQGNYIDYVYIPVERIEWLLTNIFLRWRVEIKDVKIIANSVVVTVRLHYYNHTDNEWLWQDGIGAAPLQTDKGAGATDFNAIKSNAVQIGAPAAETYAFKDAAEKIGKLFGKDLNRKEVISFDSLTDRYEKIMN